MREDRGTIKRIMSMREQMKQVLTFTLDVLEASCGGRQVTLELPASPKARLGPFCLHGLQNIRIGRALRSIPFVTLIYRCVSSTHTHTYTVRFVQNNTNTHSKQKKTQLSLVHLLRSCLSCVCVSPFRPLFWHA